MNSIANFRKCTLSNKELLERVDIHTDNIYQLVEIPPRHIPALPDRDFDLLVGELMLRFKEMEEVNEKVTKKLDIAMNAFEKILDTDMQPYDFIYKTIEKINKES